MAAPRRRLSRAAAALSLALASWSVPPAHASCPSLFAGGTSLDGAAARAHAEWIDAHLAVTAHSARIWTWSWGGGIGASGVASLAVVPFVAKADRIDWYTSAGSAAVGVLPFLLAPLAVMDDSKALHQRLAALPAGASEGDVCALLTDAESKLVRDAEDERSQQRWYVHVGNLAFNTGVMLFLGLGYHRWESGIINGVAGAVVGEALILTQPNATVDEAAAYRSGREPPGGPRLAIGYANRF